MYLSHSQKRERTQKFSIESIIKHYSLNVVSHCIAFLKGNSDKCEICTQVLKPDKAAAHRPMASQAVPHPRVPSHHHIHTARLSVGQRESTASLSGCVQLPWGPTSYSMIPIRSDRASRAHYPESSQHGPQCIHTRLSFCSAPLANRARCLLLPFVPTEPHKKEIWDSKMKK